jgi:branched-chain amino acid transport system permease protein
MRDDEGAAEGIGVRLLSTKFRVYVLAAFGCGATGALVYLNLLRVQPEAAFGVGWSASAIFIVIIGGIGTIEGPILGTLLFFALRETLSDYGSWYLILLGTVAVVVMLVAPRGLWGLVTQRWGVELFPVRRRLRRRPQTLPESVQSTTRM